MEKSQIAEDIVRQIEQRNLDWAVGYTSSAKKLDVLQQGNFKDIVIPTNEKALKFERTMKLKTLILCSLLFARHQGGSESLDDFMTFAEKLEATQPDDFALNTALDSTFLCTPVSLLQVIQNNQSVLKATFREMYDQSLGIEPGSLFETGISGSQEDLRCMHLRRILVSTIQSQKSEPELRELCVRLLYRVGLIRASPEDLVLAAKFQLLFKIDISDELRWMCSQSEVHQVFVTDTKNSNATFELKDKRDLIDQIAYNENQDQSTLSHDYFASDEDFIYNFSGKRGLTRFKVNQGSKQAVVDVQNQEVKNYKHLTFVFHQGQMFVRHAGLPNQPFEVFDKATLKPIENQQPFTSQDPDEMMKWTDENYSAPEAESDHGTRFMRRTPLASDGEYIYALTTGREEKHDSAIRTISCEIYEVIDHHISLVSKINLLKENGDAYVGSRRRYKDQDGFLGHVNIACNGSFLILFTPERMHVFDLDNGTRVAKTKLGLEHRWFDSKKNLMFYVNHSSNSSFMKSSKIQGFKQKPATALKTRLPKLPIIFDTYKLAIATELADVSLTDRDPAKIHEKLIKEAVEDELGPKEKEGSKALKFDSGIKDIHETTFGVILSVIGCYALISTAHLKSIGSKPLVNDELLEFFKTEYSTHLSRDYINTLIEQVNSLNERAYAGKVKATELFSLLNVLRLLDANLKHMKSCRLSLDKILNTEDLANTKKLNDEVLAQLKPFEGSQGKPDDQLTTEEIVQLYIVQQAKEIHEQLYECFDAETALQKLQTLDAKLTEQDNQQSQATSQALLQLLSDQKSLSELFSGSLSEIESTRKIFEKICKFVSTSLEGRFQKALKDKIYTKGYDSKLDENASIFTNKFCEEMMVAYSNQLLVLLETADAHETLAMIEKEGDDSSVESIKKPYFKFYQNNEVIDEVPFESDWASMEDKLKETLKRYGGGNGTYKHDDGKVYQLRNLTEFDEAIETAGNKVMAVQYHNGCPTAERGWDEMKINWKNIHMYKVNTLNSYDIRDKYADGSSKPFFKFYRKGEFIDEVKYMSNWSQHRPKVEEVLAKYNGPDSSGRYKPAGPVEELKILSDFKEVMEEAKEAVVAICYHSGEKQPLDAWNQLKLDNQNVWLFNINTTTYSAGSSKIAKLNVKRFDTATDKIKALDQVFYQTFIDITNQFKDQMSSLIEGLWKLDLNNWSDAELKDLLNYIEKALSDENCLLRSIKKFCLMFCTFNVQITWLDEIAEGIKNVATLLSDFTIFTQNLPSKTRKSFRLQDPASKFLSESLRQITYTIGVITQRLIKAEDGEHESNSLKSLMDLNLLHGGIEDRFIPSLTDETKHQIEGSFKITNDQELRDFALKKQDQVQLTPDDQFLLQVIGKDAEADEQVEIALNVLQLSLEAKAPACTFAKLAGDDGLRLTRAAFGVLLKFTESIDSFHTFSMQAQDLDQDIDFEFECEDRLKELAKKMQEKDTPEFKDLLQRWEQASQMRKWADQTQSSLLDKIQKRVVQEFRREFDAEHPSEPPFTAALSEEQQATVDLMTSERHKAELQKAFDEVVLKSHFLLKLQVPQMFRSRQNEALNKLQKKASTIAQQEAAAREAKNAQSQAQKKTSSSPDSQRDWINQLKLWNHVSKQTGEGSNSGQEKEGSKSCSVSILSCLQRIDYSAKQLQARVEKTLILGLRRSAGINLMDFAFGLNISNKLFYDLLQWFQGSLRRNRSHSAHYLDGVKGCGERISQDIQQKFFLIIERVVDKLKVVNKKDKIIHLIDALCWEYTRQDHDKLARLNIFKVLSQGNGERNSLLKTAWGQQTGEVVKDKESDLQLPSRLMQAFQYLFLTILEGIVADTQTSSMSSSETKEAGLSQIMSTTSTGTAQAAESLINQISAVLFSNINKYLEIRRLQPFILEELLKQDEQRFTQSVPITEGKRGTIDYLMDDFEFFRLKYGEDGEKKWLKEEKVRLHKINAKLEEFVDKVNAFAQSNGEDSAFLTTLKEVVGKALGSEDQGAIVSAIRERKLVAIESVKNASYEDLGLVEPELTQEQIAVITGEQEQPEEEKQADPEENKQEEEKEVFHEDGFGTRYRAVQLEGNDVDFMLLSENGSLHAQDETFSLIAAAENFQDFGIVIKPQYIKPWPPRQAAQEENKNEEQKEIAQGDSQPDSESALVAKKSDQEIQEMIKALEKVEEGEKLFVNEKERVYHEDILFKMLSMLDFLFSLLQTSPHAKTLVSGFMQPNQLTHLIDLSVEGLSRVQNIVQRIFQNLLRLDLPGDLFEQAVEISLKREVDGKPWHCENEVKRLLELQDTIKFEKSNFVKLIFNKIVELRSATYQSSIATRQLENNPMTYERARTIRILFTQGESQNVALREAVTQSLKPALLKLEELSDPVMEASLLMVYESGLKPLTSGQPCTDRKGQLFTVFGYRKDKQYAFTEEFPIEFKDTEKDIQCFCVSYGQGKPMREEVTCQEWYQLEPVLDLDRTESVVAAKLSLLNDAEVVECLINIWLKYDPYFVTNGNYRLQLMHLGISSGFKNMINLLGQEYVGFLKVNELLEPVFSKLALSSANFYQIAWQQKCLLNFVQFSAIIQSTEWSFKPSQEVTINVSDDGKNLVCQVKQQARTVFLKLPSIRWVSEDPSKKPTLQLEGTKQQQKCIMVSSKEMQACSLRVLDMFKGKQAYHAVITDQDIDLVKFLNDMKKAIAGYGGSASGSGEYNPEDKIYQLKNLGEFDQAVADAGQMVLAVMYHNGCSTQEHGWDEMKPLYPNVRMYKVNTLNSYDIRDRYADGGSKPYFKFYRQGEKFDEVKYESNWSNQKPKLEVKMKEFQDAAGGCGTMVPRFLVVGKEVYNELKNIQVTNEVELNKTRPGWLYSHLYNKLDCLKKVDQQKYSNIPPEMETNMELVKDTFVQAFGNSENLSSEQKEQISKAIDEILAEENPKLPELKLEKKENMYRSSSEDDLKSKIVDMQDNLGLLKVLQQGSHHFTDKDKARDRFFDSKEHSQQQLQKIVDFTKQLLKNEIGYSVTCFNETLETIKILEMFEDRSCMERLLLALSEEETKDLINSPEVYSQICDFLHLHLDMQEIATKRSKLAYVEDCKDTLSVILGKLGRNTAWTDHFARDLQTRMIKTIAALDERRHFQGSYSGEGQLVELIKNNDIQTCLEPVCLVFFSKQILEHNYLQEASLQKFSMCVFDVCLYYTLLLNSDYYASMQGIDLLHDGCLVAIRKIRRQSELKVTSGSKINDQELLTWLTRKFLSDKDYFMEEQYHYGNQKDQPHNFNQPASQRQQVMFLIHQERAKIYNLLQTDSLEGDEHPDNKLLNWSHYSNLAQVIEQGKSFENFISKSNYEMLLSSDERFYVSKFLEKYQTEAEKFDIQFEKEFTVQDEGTKLELTKYTLDDGLKVSVNNGQKILILNKNQVSTEESTVQFSKGDSVKISFPFKALALSRYTWNQQPIEQAIYQDGVSQLICQAEHGLVVSQDETILGFGYRVQGQKSGLLAIDKPESCKNYKKIVCGKFQRVILTKEGLVFFQGENKNQIVAPTAIVGQHAYCHGFNQIYFNNEDDVIVDIACGRHFIVCITQSGKVHARGKGLYNDIQAKVPGGLANQFMLKVPDGYKAIRCWASDKTHTVFINAVKTNGAIVTLALGDENMRGTGYNNNIQDSFQPLDITADSYMVEIKCQDQVVCGLDQNGNLWQWGKQTSKKHGDVDCVDSREQGIKKPMKYDWFQKQGLQILDFDCGKWFVIVKCLEPNCQIGYYGIQETIKTGGNNVLGENFKLLYGESICKLNNEFFGLENVQHFGCNRYIIYFIKGKPELKPKPSIIPGKPSERGLIHFYRKDNQWHFMTQDEYEQKKSALPLLSFACRYPIDGFSDKTFPDLEQLEDQLSLFIQITDQEEQVWPIKLTNVTELTNKVSDPLYYANSKFGDQDQKIFASEKEVLEGGNWFDMNPLIYYRISKPCKDVDSLPAFDLAKFFKQQPGQAEFMIRKVTPTPRDLAQLPKSSLVKRVMEFTPEMDHELLLQIDKQLPQSNLEKMFELSMYNIQKMKFRGGSPLARTPAFVIEARIKLLLQYTEAFLSFNRYYLECHANKPGTLANLFKKGKALVVPQRLREKFNDRLLAADRNGCQNGIMIQIDRSLSMNLNKSRKGDHCGKYSFLGQFKRQLSIEPSELNKLSYLNKLSQRNYRHIEFSWKNEDKIESYDYYGNVRRVILTELHSDILPLLIQSPNNRNELGQFRDRFILNPSSSTPSHLSMFKFLGGLIAHSLMAHEHWKFRFTPLVWKQIIGDQLTLADLEDVDSFSYQMLKNLKQKGSQLTEAEFDSSIDLDFTTVLSNGDQIELCSGGKDIKVTKENLDRYIEQVTQARLNESAKQVEAVTIGIKECLDYPGPIFDLLNWDQLEEQVCGVVEVETQKLQAISFYTYCDESHEVVERFWRVFESFTQEERKQYLRFVWGRTAIPEDTSKIKHKHQLRLVENLSRTGLPQAHPSLFQLDIPFYETDEVCSQMLSLAMERCKDGEDDQSTIEQALKQEIK